MPCSKGPWAGLKATKDILQDTYYAHFQAVLTANLALALSSKYASKKEGDRQTAN